jgi:hypothetical protein
MQLLKTPHSAARPPGESDDWLAFYVNMYVSLMSYPTSSHRISNSFVDCDMFMRYVGGGVHQETPKIP